MNRNPLRFLRGALSLSLLVSLSALAGPKITMVEDAIEAQGVEVSVDSSGNGTAVVWPCQDCDPRSLAVTPATKAFENGVEVPLSRARRIADKYVVVFFTIADETVSRITW